MITCPCDIFFNFLLELKTVISVPRNNLCTSLCHQNINPSSLDQIHQVISNMSTFFFCLYKHLIKTWISLFFFSALVQLSWLLFKSHPCVSLYLYPGDFVSYICVEISGIADVMFL